MASSSKQIRQKIHNTEKPKNVFFKRIGKNADLHISVMNKIMTTHE